MEIWVSDDNWEEEISEYLTPTEAEDHLWECIDRLLRTEPEYAEYIQLYAKKKKIPPIAALSAHGDSTENDEWVYQDGDTLHALEEWIRNLDGKFGCLIVFSCNPASLLPPHSTYSLIMFPDCSFPPGCIESMAFNEVHFELCHPKKGIITGYTISHELALLKKSGKKNK